MKTNTQQLLLSMKEASRVLNKCGADPVERSYQIAVEEYLRILNELNIRTCTEIFKEAGVKEL